MTKILIAFHSHDGQSEKVADRIAARLRGAGIEVDEIRVHEAPPVRGYDAVVVGDSIRFERHSRALVRYLERNHDDLSRIPVALFQVSMTSAKTDPEHLAISEQFVAKLLDKTGVRPRVVANVAGALRYTRYGWITRRVMRAIARREGNSTDVTHDHEYTDWGAVDGFADEVIALAVTKAEAS